MTSDDLKRLFLSPVLFRLDTILSPRLVPILYGLGLMSVLLWAVGHLFATFGRNFGEGLWGLLEIAVFGLLAIVVIRIGCEALLVYFKTHEAETETVKATRVPSTLLEEVREAIHDLADEDEDYSTPGTEPAPPAGPTAGASPRGRVVKRTAKRTPPAL